MARIVKTQGYCCVRTTKDRRGYVWGRIDVGSLGGPARDGPGERAAARPPVEFSHDSLDVELGSPDGPSLSAQEPFNPLPERGERWRRRALSERPGPYADYGVRRQPMFSEHRHRIPQIGIEASRQLSDGPIGRIKNPDLDPPEAAVESGVTTVIEEGDGGPAVDVIGVIHLDISQSARPENGPFKVFPVAPQIRANGKVDVLTCPDVSQQRAGRGSSQDDLRRLLELSVEEGEEPINVSGFHRGEADRRSAQVAFGAPGEGRTP